MRKILFSVISFLSLSFAASQDVRLLVSHIQATPLSSSEIEVTWQLPPLSGNIDSSQLSLLLYRGEQQKVGSISLDEMTPIATLPYNTTSYVDTPNKNTTFYYTVLIASSENNAEALLVPASNTTVVGARLLPQTMASQDLARETIKEKPNAATGMRNTPLPYLKLPLQQSKTNNYSVDPERKQREAHAEKLDKKTTASNLPESYIFRQEQETENVGEDFILQDIITTQFMAGEYGLAEDSLRDFLSINHSSDAIDRATFYLGETLLYQGKYQQALSCFLAVQDRYPDLTIRWIQAALDGYQLPIIE